jgi:hypothetical protein
MRIMISFCRTLAFAAMAALLFAIPATPSAPGALTLFDGHRVSAIVYDPSGGAPIANAAALLSHDLTQLTGEKPAIASSGAGLDGTAVLIGPANGPMIAPLLKANGISAAPIDGKWETYGRAVVPAPWNPNAKVLVIFGSDTRGTIWGVVDLTREMGVSAWEWWADVKIRKRARIAVSAALYYSKPPSVKYRGIFLNDEEYGINPWASKTYDPKLGNIGPKTYARIFKLMWRLKANTIWPAMHGITISFNQIPENAKLADDYAIIHASSHVEMRLRTNAREWNPKTMGPYNWLTNRKALIDYWTGAVKEFGQYENLYTVGLRGPTDRPMEGAATPQQMANVLGDVITQQRKILTDVLHKPADQVPQVFTPYKEILPAYDTGLLHVPGDVTLNWPDDNFGYIRRLSNAQERKRPGGAGIYYHISYWGGPMSYLWLAGTHPGLMWEEMTKAYHFDARRLWILNVGDIKPGEYLTQLFLDMAFDADAFPDVASVKAHLLRWTTTNFGADHAQAIADILWRYYDLAFDRNPEFMGWTTSFPETAVTQTKFNMLDFGDENARRAAAYKDIMAQAKALAAQMPVGRRGAFFQLVQYPVDAAGDMNLRQLALDKSIAYGLQRRESANVYAQKAQAAQAQIDSDAHYYNDVMEGGKWRGMMGLHPHNLPVYEAPHIPVWSSNGDKSCAIQVEGGAVSEGGRWGAMLPAFHRELRRSRYVDIFVEGPVAANWTATPSAPWIRLSKSSGSFSPAAKRFEQRIEVSADWASAPADGKGGIAIQCGTQSFTVRLMIAPANTVKNVSFIEADRIVSIYATHADRRSGAWQVLNGFGHTGAYIRTSLDMASVANDPAAILKAPSLTYRFATETTNDVAALKVIALPTLPITSDNGVRVAVSIDGSAPKILNFDAAEFSAAWKRHVLTNAAVETIHGLALKPGAHTLKVYALDPGVTLGRFEVAFQGAPKAYLPVPETRIAY